MIRRMAMGNSFGLMVVNTKECGSMVNSMGKVCMFNHQGLRERESGVKVRGSNGLSQMTSLLPKDDHEVLLNKQLKILMDEYFAKLYDILLPQNPNLPETKFQKLMIRTPYVLNLMENKPNFAQRLALVNNLNGGALIYLGASYLFYYLSLTGIRIARNKSRRWTGYMFWKTLFLPFAVNATA